MFRGVEDISHDHEVALPNDLSLLILLYKLVQAEEFSNESIGVIFDIRIVVFEDGSQMFVLPIMDSLEHILAISRIEEERPALTLTGESTQRSDLPHHKRSHEFVGADTVDVLFIVDVEYLADVVECIGGIVSETADAGDIVLSSEPAGNQFEVILEIEVSRLLVDHLLVATYTPHCHLDTDHHIQHQVPVVIAEEYHVALRGVLSLCLHMMDVVFSLFLLHACTLV